MSLLAATISPAPSQETVVVLLDNKLAIVFIAMKYACNSYDRNGHSITY